MANFMARPNTFQKPEMQTWKLRNREVLNSTSLWKTKYTTAKRQLENVAVIKFLVKKIKSLTDPREKQRQSRAL